MKYITSLIPERMIVGAVAATEASELSLPWVTDVRPDRAIRSAVAPGPPVVRRVEMFATERFPIDVAAILIIVHIHRRQNPTAAVDCYSRSPHKFTFRRDPLRADGMTGVAGCAEQSDGSDFAEDFGIGEWDANTTIGPEVEVETFDCHRYNNIE